MRPRANSMAPRLPLMLVLFDHNTPRGVARALAGHEVTRAAQRGWAKVTNGELLAKAEAAGFELLVTADKNIAYQQNLKHRKIALVVPGNSTWHYVRPHLASIVAAVNEALPGSYTEVEIPLPPKNQPKTRWVLPTHKLS